MNSFSLNYLKLVYPPISNQEGDWLLNYNDKQLKEILNQSKIYMIGHRPDIKFILDDFLVNDGKIIFSLKSGKAEIRNAILNCDYVFEKNQSDELKVELGEKIIRICNNQNHLLEWFTPDKLLYEYWQRKISIQNFLAYRNFTEFELYYIGISPKNGSFSRLFETGHKNRTKILSNANVKSPSARLTDELMLFLYDINPLTIVQNISPQEALSEGTIYDYLMKTCPPNIETLVREAEKAFVSLAQTKYNKMKYSGYSPKSSSLNCDRNGFIINEDVCFYTGNTKIVGASDIANKHNCIVVDKQKDAIFYG